MQLEPATSCLRSTGFFDEVEAQVDHEKDHWGNTFVWSMFQSFHDEARRAAEAGAEFLKIAAVPFVAIDKRIRRNLEGEGWKEERAAYQGLL